MIFNSSGLFTSEIKFLDQKIVYEWMKWLILSLWMYIIVDDKIIFYNSKIMELSLTLKVGFYYPVIYIIYFLLSGQQKSWIIYKLSRKEGFNFFK